MTCEMAREIILRNGDISRAETVAASRHVVNCRPCLSWAEDGYEKRSAWDYDFASFISKMQFVAKEAKTIDDEL